MMLHRRSFHPIVVARQAARRRREYGADAGFTLIEMVVTIAILPIVVGAIAVALISVFSLQGTVSSRVTDSNDALVASAYFNKDVQEHGADDDVAERVLRTNTSADESCPDPTPWP